MLGCNLIRLWENSRWVVLLWLLIVLWFIGRRGIGGRGVGFFATRRATTAIATAAEKECGLFFFLFVRGHGVHRRLWMWRDGRFLALCLAVGLCLLLLLLLFVVEGDGAEADWACVLTIVFMWGLLVAVLGLVLGFSGWDWLLMLLLVLLLVFVLLLLLLLLLQASPDIEIFEPFSRPILDKSDVVDCSVFREASDVVDSSWSLLNNFIIWLICLFGLVQKTTIKNNNREK